jgi:hypothetical protein
MTLRITLMLLLGMAACGSRPALARAAVTASLDNGTLTLASNGNGVNVVDVRFDGTSYWIYNSSSKNVAGGGCQPVSQTAARCTGDIGAITVTGGSGPDVYDLRAVPVPVDASGGAGNDFLRGGVAANVLSGGDGVDELQGGASADRLDGGSGDDFLLGGRGADTESGDTGADILRGQAGSGDVLIGGDGRDLLQGGRGDDLLEGDAGSDVLVGGPGDDTLSPGDGADSVLRPQGADALQCPVPLSTATASLAPCAAIVDAAAPTTWPPTASSAAPAQTSANAWPVTPGYATAIGVLLPDWKRRRVHVCVRTRDYHLKPLRSYDAVTYTKFFEYIRQPHPPRNTFVAHVTIGRC